MIELINVVLHCVKSVKLQLSRHLYERGTNRRIHQKPLTFV